MLKIKDDVDLKELEKFGFTNEESGFKNCYTKNIDYTNYEYNKIYIMKNNRIVRLGHYQDEYGATDTLNLDIIYDLIQAGLVEKVSDR